MNLRFLFFVVMVAGLVGWPLYAETPNIEEETITPEFVAKCKAKAEAGDVESQAILGLCYENGMGIEKNAAKAMEWFRKAAEQDSSEGQWQLGLTLYKSGDSEKVREAITWLEKAANQDHGKAMMVLAKCYAEGIGVKENTKKAVLWNTKGAEQGMTPCMIWLSMNDPDKKKRNTWLEKGAKLGDAACQYLLGLNYEYGNGVAKDADKAMDYYRQAALQDYTDAIKKCGRSLAKESFEKNDYAEAAFWFRKLVASGEEDVRKTKLPLGLCEDRLGHQEEAYKWMRQCAEQGDDWGQYYTGMYFFKGEGVEKDLEAAVFWFEKAAAQGNESAQEVLEILRRK